MFLEDHWTLVVITAVVITTDNQPSKPRRTCAKRRLNLTKR